MMAKAATKKKLIAVVHDHFDGSANCVQCNGECKLTGSDLLATQMVRYIFEFMVYQGHFALPGMLRSVMVEAGIDIEHCIARASERSDLPLIKRKKTFG